jgi:hypothetical protein
MTPPDVSFATPGQTNYPFPATGAPTGRTMPDRLNDIINVKDWGAKGNGIDDDTAAISAAVAYAYVASRAYLSRGAGAPIVFVPPGVYKISDPGVELDNVGHGGCLKFIGAGRDTTKLTGTYNTGFIVHKMPPGNNTDALNYIADMTIENNSTTEGSGALNFAVSQNAFVMSNCRFKGYIGANIAQGAFPPKTGTWFPCNIFGTQARNCIFECSVPITQADSATLSPTPTAGALYPDDPTASIGLLQNQGQLINCFAKGFNVGFALSGPGVSVVANRASQCGVGFWLGLGGGGVVTSSSIMANVADRCGIGIFGGSGGTVLAANVIQGTSGQHEPAAISRMSWNNISHVVTVTTAAAHNIPSDQKLILSVDDPSWVPPIDGMVTATVAGQPANQFTYPGPSSRPAAFSRGTWNYPVQAAMTIKSAIEMEIAANVLSAVAARASVDLNNFGSIGNEYGTLMAMTGPYGWIMPFAGAPGVGIGIRWRVVKCGMPGVTTNPQAWIKVADIAAYEGDTLIAIDCQLQNNFRGAIRGGGTNHYKVKSGPTGLIRVG